jgi:MerR family redox-sensitive transcriptional activator SoxR
MLIGEVARRAGLTPSALRYYEREALLPRPARSANRRSYDARIMGRIRIIQLARSAGFSIAETRAFVASFSGGDTPSGRWQAMAARKVQELDALISTATRMKSLLRSSFRCGCTTIEDCERLMGDRSRSPRVKSRMAVRRKTPATQTRMLRRPRSLSTRSHK